jgi:hypothetical protein
MPLGQKIQTDADPFVEPFVEPGSHEIWFNPATNRYTTIPNHPGDMPEGTLRAILKQAGVEPETFLGK